MVAHRIPLSDERLSWQMSSYSTFSITCDGWTTHQSFDGRAQIPSRSTPLSLPGSTQPPHARFKVMIMGSFLITTAIAAFVIFNGFVIIQNPSQKQSEKSGSCIRRLQSHEASIETTTRCQARRSRQAPAVDNESAPAMPDHSTLKIA
jgi:hypothetical protein